MSLTLTRVRPAGTGDLLTPVIQQRIAPVQVFAGHFIMGAFGAAQRIHDLIMGEKTAFPTAWINIEDRQSPGTKVVNY